jgi:hypothetical protein
MTFNQGPLSKWMLLIYHQRPLCVDVVDLIVLLVILFYSCTSPLASTEVDVDSFNFFYFLFLLCI